MFSNNYAEMYRHINHVQQSMRHSPINTIFVSDYMRIYTQLKPFNYDHNPFY